MSLRLEMLQVARLAPRALGESAALVAGFLRSQLDGDGGFYDREGKSDLYYTVFGTEGLLALQADVPYTRIDPYLRSFANGDDLDLVHLACLARAWAAFPRGWPRPVCPEAIVARVEAHRAADGGYHAQPDAKRGSLYGGFLAIGAYQDLGLPLPAPDRLADSIERLRASDGGYANDSEMPIGLTPPTAAAVVLLRQLGRTPDPAIGRWLLERCRPSGGFFATPLAPVPDLLSTATALHALAAMHVDFQAVAEPCLDFVDSLWTNRGGFFGTWEDDALDCEYTYYGLLALGHLAHLA